MPALAPGVPGHRARREGTVRRYRLRVPAFPLTEIHSHALAAASSGSSTRSCFTARSRSRMATCADTRRIWDWTSGGSTATGAALGCWSVSVATSKVASHRWGTTRFSTGGEPAARSQARLPDGIVAANGGAIGGPRGRDQSLRLRVPVADSVQRRRVASQQSRRTTRRAGADA